jgi:hypothetical protein
MKKTFLTLTLSVALTLSTLAGEIPISGYEGCAPGLWYPISQICCMPDVECPVGGRPAPDQPIKEGSVITSLDVVRVILYFRNIF